MLPNPSESTSSLCITGCSCGTITVKITCFTHILVFQICTILLVLKSAIENVSGTHAPQTLFASRTSAMRAYTPLFYEQLDHHQISSNGYENKGRIAVLIPGYDITRDRCHSKSSQSILSLLWLGPNLFSLTPLWVGNSDLTNLHLALMNSFHLKVFHTAKDAMRYNVANSIKPRTNTTYVKPQVHCR